MTGKYDRDRTKRVVVESTLTRQMYARILLLLGVRSWGFIILAAILLYILWMSVNTGNYLLLIIYAALLVVIYGGAVLVSVVAKKNRRAYAPVKYTFNGSGVIKETAATSQTLRWNAFVKWRKVGGYYLIYSTKRSFFVIPRSKIPEDKVYFFESLLSQNIVKRQFKLAR